MTYSFDLTLKKIRQNTWQLVTEKNTCFYEFKAQSKVEAMDKARLYMSSWASVRIILEDDDGERKEGN